METRKSGISLIVLVITIIVMIILATAIILSISNSGIMSKANKAKKDSDTANLTEYVNVLKAEWDLMTETERGDKSEEAYVNENLEAKGYTGALLMDDGTLYTNLQANAKEALKDGIKIGDVVEYTVTSKTEPSKLADNGSQDQNVILEQTELTWKYIGISDNGEIMITPDVTKSAPKLILKGATGYIKGPDELNRLCKVLYSTDKGTARSMTIEDVVNIIGYTFSEGSFIDEDNVDVSTDVAMSIADLEKQNGSLKHRFTPDGKDIGLYASNELWMSFAISMGIVDQSFCSFPGNLTTYIFQPYDYWLASPCVKAYFLHEDDGFALDPYADFGCYEVSSDLGPFLRPLFSSINSEDSSGQVALRPVVSLNANVQLRKDINDGGWKDSSAD